MLKKLQYMFMTLAALLLAIGWLVVRPKVVAHTDNRLKAAWTTERPTYPTKRGEPGNLGEDEEGAVV